MEDKDRGNCGIPSDNMTMVTMAMMVTLINFPKRCKGRWRNLRNCLQPYRILQ